MTGTGGQLTATAPYGSWKIASDAPKGIKGRDNQLPAQQGAESINIDDWEMKAADAFAEALRVSLRRCIVGLGLID